VLTGLGTPGGRCAPAEKPEPAVSVRKSVTPDYIICLEDGRKLKMLKRYLRTTYNMTSDDSRAKWGLPADYPMVAPTYAAARTRWLGRSGWDEGAGLAEEGGSMMRGSRCFL